MAATRRSRSFFGRLQRTWKAGRGRRVEGQLACVGRMDASRERQPEGGRIAAAIYSRLPQKSARVGGLDWLGRAGLPFLAAALGRSAEKSGSRCRFAADCSGEGAGGLSDDLDRGLSQCGRDESNRTCEAFS